MTYAFFDEADQLPGWVFDKWLLARIYGEHLKRKDTEMPTLGATYAQTPSEARRFFVLSSGRWRRPLTWDEANKLAENMARTAEGVDPRPYFFVVEARVAYARAVPDPPPVTKYAIHDLRMDGE